MKKKPSRLTNTVPTRPNKLLGQNFLRSEKIVLKIIDTAKLSSSDTVLEVGPGKGILTKELVSRAGHVIAIEKDARFAEHIKQEFAREKNLEILCNDILRIDRELIGLREGDYTIVANLPYYLTSHFLRLFLEKSPRPKTMVLMVQKEVALRIIASPPNMNLLALSVQAFGRPRIVVRVPKELFSPKPKVDSAVIEISQISEKFFTDNHITPSQFFQLTKKAFAQKRKMLRNSLGINSEKRPQELSLEDWLVHLR
ncbi:MAG: 16S rRNA (adenine(1518)-N(6)/adenine(1519)-N(6))-dimethyltransferase RsmA [Patescibacteria group bacterium]